MVLKPTLDNWCGCYGERYSDESALNKKCFVKLVLNNFFLIAEGNDDMAIIYQFNNLNDSEEAFKKLCLLEFVNMNDIHGLAKSYQSECIEGINYQGAN